MRKSNLIVPVFLSHILTIILILFISLDDLKSHCQIPCGIYDDEARLKNMYEDVNTIRKSIDSINQLNKDGKKNYNQIVRWVINKENHANHIKESALNYFLTQRIKPSDDNYTQKLLAIHKVIILAMKNKQSSDISVIDQLEKAVKEFTNLYLGIKEDKK